MRSSRIKSKLADKVAALCTSVTFTDPIVFELVSRLGFDGIWLDLEHHGHSVESAANYIRATRVGVSDVIARPAKGEFTRMARLLEVGAAGIMYPRCESAEEAAEVVRFAKFSPVGKRGFDGANVDADYAGVPVKEYIAHANRETLIIIQVEDQAALNQAEAIAAVPGVDALMLGPADFSILEGFPGEFSHPRADAAHQQIAAAVKKQGKHWARTIATLEQAKQSLEWGASILFFGSDIAMLRRGLEQIQKDVSPLVSQLAQK